MAAVLQADARATDADIPAPNGVVTSGPQTVAIQGPYENCKAKVIAVVNVQPAADNTHIGVEIVRNPNAEAVVVAQVSSFNDFSVQTGFQIPIAGVDVIPDGRDVVYVAVVVFLGGAGDGVIGSGSYIESMILSG